MKVGGPKYLPIGAYLPGRKIVEYLVLTDDLVSTLAEITWRAKEKGVEIVAGNLTTDPRSPIKHFSFFADLTNSEITPEELEKELTKVEGVKEVLSQPGTSQGLVVDRLHFPLMVMEERAITLRVETFGDLLQNFNQVETNKLAFFRMGVKAGLRKARKVIQLGLSGIQALDFILTERIAKGWGLPTIKKFNGDTVEVEMQELFECLPFKGKGKESKSQFFRGYLSGVVSGLIGKEVVMEETKCIAKGDKCCYFVSTPGSLSEVGTRPSETPQTREELFSVIKEIFGEDLKFKALKFLARKEVASIREIARKINIAPKNLTRHLDYLLQKGVIETVYSGKNIKLYRLSSKVEVLGKFLRSDL
ncbi:MAG: V4R domain-containing protein [Candidatus Hadarchaeales archaeon]